MSTMSKRIARLAIVAGVVAALGWEAGGSPAPTVEPADAAPEPAGRPASDDAPWVRFRISKETTRLTEPLTDEGHVDYAAALNAQYSKGVTRENNAAVALIEVMPSLVGHDNEKILGEICKRLSIPIPPKDGEYWVSREDRGVSRDLVETATGGPWPQDRLPQIAKWLAANEKFLDRLIDASRRTRFFVPISSTGGFTMDDIEFPRAPLIVGFSPANAPREVVDALIARAMLRVEEKRFAAARRDLVAAHRWSRLAGQQPFLIDWLVSTSTEKTVCRAEVAFALHEELPSQELDSLRKSLKDLPARLPLSEVFDRAERYAFLDNVQLISEGPVLRVIELLTMLTAAHQPEPSSLFVALIDFEAMGQSIVGRAYQLTTNWSGILRAGNDWYDRCVRVLEIETSHERLDRLKKLDGEFRTLRGWFPNEDQVLRRQQLRMLMLWMQGHRLYVAWPVASLWTLGEVLHDPLLSLLLISPLQPAHGEYSAEALLEIARIAIEIAAYRQEHRRLPNSLDDLVPGRFEELPRDPYSGQPYRYRRDGQGIVLYSVGRNGRDEQGTPPEPHVHTDGKLDDIAVRWMPRER